MLRRLVSFLAIALLIGAAASLVYFNSEPTVMRLTPEHSFELRLGFLLLLAMAAGSALVFLIALAREGRNALRQWRVTREKRIAERSVQTKAEARSLMLAGDYSKARSLMERAGRRSLPNVGDLVDYAETFALEENAAKARETLQKGIREFGNDPVLLHALARHCRALGDYPAALSAVERAVASFPSSHALQELRRDLLVETKSWTKAAEAQREVVDLKPTDMVEKRRLLDYRLRAAKRQEPAARDNAVKSLLTIDPEYAPAAVLRAETLAANSDVRGAIKVLERACKHEPYKTALDAVERIGARNPEKLAQTLERIAEAHPDVDDVKIRLAKATLAAGDTAKASGILDGLGDDAPGAIVETLRGEIAREEGNAAVALDCYRRALGLAPIEEAESDAPEPLALPDAEPEPSANN